MLILAIRHAHQKSFFAPGNSPLSLIGVMQAISVAKVLPFAPDFVVHSPLIRAERTAGYLKQNGSVLLKDPRLSEVYYVGSLEHRVRNLMNCILEAGTIGNSLLVTHSSALILLAMHLRMRPVPDFKHLQGIYMWVERSEVRDFELWKPF